MHYLIRTKFLTSLSAGARSSSFIKSVIKDSLNPGNFKTSFGVRRFSVSYNRFNMADQKNSNKSFRLALVQQNVGEDRDENLRNTKKMIEEAVKGGAQLIGLPECFNSPYGIQYFPTYAEQIPDGETCKLISSLAKELKVYIIAGSIPERGADDKIYNTCTVYDPSGNLIGKHRKVHLFDIDVPGKITFKESTVLSPGNTFTVVDTSFCKIGIGICYDIRFPELAQLYREAGCDMLVYPGAFNMTTGPAHWELLQRSRATDNQVFVATISPARDESGSYVAWGHSSVIDPWGKVQATTDEKQSIVYADIDLSSVESVREQIPVFKQRRGDMYVLRTSSPTPGVDEN